jgi:acyl-CoA hydrolase
MELNNMSKPTIRIHNTETDDVIDREMNDAEFAEYEADKMQQAIIKAEAEAKAQAKAAAEGKLAVLGLTTDDLRALGL